MILNNVLFTKQQNVTSDFNDDAYEEEEEPEEKASSFITKLRKEKSDAKLKEIQARDKDGSLMALHKIWSLIPDTFSMTDDEIVDMLVKGVVYNERDLIALNKPYGMPSVYGVGQIRPISSFLEPLRKILAPNSKRLRLVHRLDKATTGVLLIAASQLRHSELKDMFRKKSIIKKYWTITRSIPDPPEGIIKIPLGLRKVSSRGAKMIPLPKRTEENEEAVRNRISPGAVYDAVTEYRILAESKKCALVETTIPTGVRHQIRSHLSFGIGCPVLGDHKYSNFEKFVPQRLPPDMLQMLGIRSSKARHLPLYLHAKEIVLPEYENGRNFFIRSKLPQFFTYTMKRLRLHLR